MNIRDRGTTPSLEKSTALPKPIERSELTIKNFRSFISSRDFAITTLVGALEKAGEVPWQLDVFGPLLDETRQDREAYRGQVPVRYHGAVGQGSLAEAMRHSDLLVLPSLEEGFGLVVVQALACGLPCAVSSMVGAKDLIEEGVNGSVWPSGDVEALLACLRRWEASPRRVSGSWDWSGPAARLLEVSRDAMKHRSQTKI